MAASEDNPLTSLVLPFLAEYLKQQMTWDLVKLLPTGLFSAGASVRISSKFRTGRWS